MTAADHRTIIEKGADYRIDIQVSENGIDMKDVTGYSVAMVIKYEDTDGSIVVLDTIAGILVDDVLAGLYTVGAGNFEIGVEYTIKTIGTTDFTLIGSVDNVIGTVFTATGAGEGTGEATIDVAASGTYLNGNVAVVIDKTVTATYATRVTDGLSPFMTEYNYFYTIDITEDDAVSVDKDNVRILRGKLAIRE